MNQTRALKTPNKKLQRQRELRGWSQLKVAHELGTTEKIVSRWECGDSKPSPFYREKLLLLFRLTAQELGFTDESRTECAYEDEADNASPVHEEAPLGGFSDVQHGVFPHFTAQQALDLLCTTPQVSSEEQAGAWLALSAGHLASLFENGWTIDEVLTALQGVLQGVQAMSIFSRRKLLQLGATATVSILLPHGRQVTAAERAALHQALGESIAAGWKLFHTIGSPQMLAVGQAQLILVQQASPELYPAVKPLFYTGVYRLIGAAQHYQNRYEEAYRSHEQAYIAALEGADVWNMAQSRGWQAYGFKARGDVPRALEVADAALRLISGREDTESLRLRARLRAFSAENAAMLGDADDVQARLDASEELLAALPGNHEEFDRVSWLQQAGACALSLQQYVVAATQLQQAFDALPVQWTLRSVATAVPLMRAYSHLQKRDEALDIAKKTLPLVTNLQSPATTREFFATLQQELLAHFPHDEGCQQFVAQAQRQLVVA